MANIYVDLSASVNGTGTASSPYNTLTSIPTTSGVVAWIRRTGDTHPFTTSGQMFAAGTRLVGWPREGEYGYYDRDTSLTAWDADTADHWVVSASADNCLQGDNLYISRVKVTANTSTVTHPLHTTTDSTLYKSLIVAHSGSSNIYAPYVTGSAARILNTKVDCVASTVVPSIHFNNVSTSPLSNLFIDIEHTVYGAVTTGMLTGVAGHSDIHNSIIKVHVSTTSTAAFSVTDTVSGGSSESNTIIFTASDTVSPTLTSSTSKNNLNHLAVNNTVIIDSSSSSNITVTAAAVLITNVGAGVTQVSKHTPGDLTYTLPASIPAEAVVLLSDVSTPPTISTGTVSWYLQGALHVRNGGVTGAASTITCNGASTISLPNHPLVSLTDEYRIVQGITMGGVTTYAVRGAYQPVGDDVPPLIIVALTTASTRGLRSMMTAVSLTDSAIWDGDTGLTRFKGTFQVQANDVARMSVAVYVSANDSTYTYVSNEITGV